MSGVYAPPLPQKVADRCRAAVVDDRIRLVHQPIAEMHDQALDGELVHGRVERNARDHVAKGDDLTQLRRPACDPVVEAPLQMNDMPQEGGLVIDRRWASSHHSDCGIVEISQEGYRSCPVSRARRR